MRYVRVVNSAWGRGGVANKDHLRKVESPEGGGVKTRNHLPLTLFLPPWNKVTRLREEEEARESGRRGKSGIERERGASSDARGWPSPSESRRTRNRSSVAPPASGMNLCRPSLCGAGGNFWEYHGNAAVTD